MTDKQRRLAELNRQMLTVALMETPGTILFGIGLYALFAGDDVFLPVLGQAPVVAGLLVVGGAIMLWGGIRIIGLTREIARLNAGPDA